jgi:peptide methionine sulfoxide reductase MsrB
MTAKVVLNVACNTTAEGKQSKVGATITYQSDLFLMSTKFYRRRGHPSFTEGADNISVHVTVRTKTILTVCPDTSYVRKKCLV